MGKAQQVEGRTVPDTAFNAAHVAPTDTGEVRKCLLREMLPLADSADLQSKPLEGRMFGCF